MKKLDYKFLDCAKTMPPLKHVKDGTCFNIANSDVALWLSMQDEIKQKLFNMAINHGVIKYDSEKKYWVGVDYDN